MAKKVFQEMASLVSAIQQSVFHQEPEWEHQYEVQLRKLIEEHLPSGSGIDNGVTIDLEKSTPEKLVLKSSFHVMDENGSYDGWIDFKLVVTPSLAYGFNLNLYGKFGKKHQDLRPYLGDLFYDSLTKKVA